MFRVEGRRHANAPSRMVAAASLGLVLGLIGGGLLAMPPASATPWSGGEPTPTNLLFYLHNASSGVAVGAASYLDVLSTANDSVPPWSGTGALSEGSHYDSVSFVVAPQLPGDLVLNGTVGASLYMNESGSAPSGGSITLSVSSVSASGVLTPLGTGPANSATQLGPGGSTAKLIALTGPTIRAAVAAGNSIEVNITVSGNTAEAYGIWWGTIAGTTYVSTVNVAASTYLTVPQVQVRGSNGTAITTLDPANADATVSIWATVSDPLGAYDFQSFPVELSVTDRATLAVVYGPSSMTPVPALAAPGALNGTYEGTFNCSGLPPGEYNFTVTAIDDTNSNLGSAVTLPAYFGREAIGVATISIGLPPVPVHVTAVDDHGLPLNGATVIVRAAGTVLAQNRTNSSGIAGFDLSNATAFTFSIEWQGVAAGSVTTTVTSPDQDIVVDASVGYPTFLLQTSAGGALAYALVSIVHPNGSVLPLRVTNASGELRLMQVPAGNYTVTAIYDDAVVVDARPVPVVGDGPIVVVAGSVWILTVTTSASGGSALSAVFVQVINATTGATVASGVTGSSGTLQFLVPAGNYSVQGSWSTTYALTSLSQSEEVSVVVSGSGATAALSFSKAYPAFTSTNEFFLVMGYGLLAVLVALMGGLLLRRRRRASAAPPSPTTTAPAWSESPSDRSDANRPGPGGHA